MLFFSYVPFLRPPRLDPYVRFVLHIVATQQNDYQFFKTLTDQVITVELKNDLSITGTLKSVDQFLNIRLDGISVEDPERHPHMMAVKNCFIRGSVVRYVRMASRSVDTTLLEDATRREAKESKR